MRRITAIMVVLAGICSLALDGLTLRVQASDYLVVDLSAGSSASIYPVSSLTAMPAGGWTDEYKTTKLVLRRVLPGTFTMGSPTDEIGHGPDETQHQVTLTQPYYVGVFEITQRQWERVMGTWPSYFNNITYRDSRPVEHVNYGEIRGSIVGTGWPADGKVDADSFMGRLRARTGRSFDLPTESQWEYAARAGTTTALNSGNNLTNTQSDAHMAEVGRYNYNGGYDYTQDGSTSVGTAKVGSYLPNAWGLYDLHGNVLEWCLDWYETYPGSISDPSGAVTGSIRMARGGGWHNDADACRVGGCRMGGNPDQADIVNYGFGFRVALPSSAASHSLPDYQYDGANGRQTIRDVHASDESHFSFVFATTNLGARCLVSWTTTLREWFPLIGFDASTVGTEITDFTTAPQTFYRTTYLPAGVSPAEGFDYPIGSGESVPEQITPERNTLYPNGPTNSPDRGVASGSGWHNVQDVGSYYATAEGVHPGEDWNFDSGTADLGMEVHAVANGKVIDITPVNLSSLQSAGYAMVIRHWLLNGDAVDSVYLHIAPDKKGDGTPNTAGDLGSESDFSFREGDLVSKGDLIAVVGDVQPNPTHLHFEMRDSEIAGLPTAQDSAASQVYWPHSNSHKYYGSTQTPGTMTLDEVTNAYSRMQSDGIIDPSDFIDDHR